MLEKIIQVLKDYREEDGLTITAETTFDELKLDSLDVVELVMNLEEEFGVSIEVTEAIKTVGDLQKIIESAS